MSTVGTQIPGNVEVCTVDTDPQQNTSFLQLAMTALRLTTSATANVKNSIGVCDRNNNTVRHRKQYSLDEVSYHDTFGDCWIVLYDRVYDVTNFLQLHPGGHDVIMEHAGRDATIAFTGHSQAAIASLQLYEIGELPPHECIYRCIGKLSATILPD